MSAVTSPIKKVLDLPRKDGGQGTVSQQLKEAGAASAPAVTTAKSISQAADEAVLARRRARRGGRALLSEARLTPEAGVGQTTLGSGPSI